MKPAGTPRWSVVIPAFNEARRLPLYLNEVVAYFEDRHEPYEVLVVDDGGTDGTSDVVTAMAREHPTVRGLRNERNAGKGAAVRRGMLAAAGRYRLFTDADGSTPIAELERLEEALAAGADVAIGSRALTDPGVSVVARPHRVLAGKLFAWTVRRLGLSGIADSQCGFKVFSDVAAEDLFGRLRTRGFGFDVELLLMAQRSGYRVAEIAVNWTHQPGGKVRVLGNGPGMLWQILLARWSDGR
jgi:dolichyl-phosphate beta-glucosyltransferase